MGKKDEKYEMIAAVAYQANVAYCEHNNLPMSSWRWDELPVDERGRRINMVRQAVEYGEHDAETQHGIWVDSLKEQGWTWGPEFNSLARKHPNLVAWRHLPEAEKVKDALFLSIVHALK